MISTAELSSNQTEIRGDDSTRIFNNILEQHNGTNLIEPKATKAIRTTGFSPREFRSTEISIEGFEQTDEFNIRGSIFRIFSNPEENSCALHSPKGFSNAETFVQVVFDKSRIPTKEIPKIPTESEGFKILFFQDPETGMYILQTHKPGSGKYFQEHTYVIDTENQRLMYSQIPMLRYPNAPEVITSDIKMAKSEETFDQLLEKLKKDKSQKEDKYANDAMRRANEY